MLAVLLSSWHLLGYRHLFGCRHLLGCLEEVQHRFDVHSKPLVHLPITFNIKPSNWGWIRYYTNKNRCNAWFQLKGTATEAGCCAQVGGTDFFLTVPIVQCNPSVTWWMGVGITMDTCCFKVQYGLLWQMKKWGVEQGNRGTCCLHFIIEIFFLQDIGTSVDFIQDSYLNHLVCFEDFKPTSISKSFSF